MATKGKTKQAPRSASLSKKPAKKTVKPISKAKVAKPKAKRTKWGDLKHKAPAEVRNQLKQEAKQKPEDTLTQEEMVKGSAELGQAVKLMDPAPPPPGVDPITTPEINDPDVLPPEPDDSVEE